MKRFYRLSSISLLAGLLLLSLMFASPFGTKEASAHGSTQNPPSRVYNCRFEKSKSSMCAEAWAANEQALWDWTEVNLGDVGGKHQERIPDGQLCGAGRDKYAAFNRPGDWPVTNLQANGSGTVELVYENTAPHATEYYRVYITREGFDARTDTLGWGDLELVHDTGKLARSAKQVMQAKIPNRKTPAILYIVWQRSDSAEAFYACSDVTVGGGSNAPTPPANPTTPTTTPETTPTTATTPTTQPSDEKPSIQISSISIPALDDAKGAIDSAQRTSGDSSIGVWRDFFSKIVGAAKVFLSSLG